MQENKKLKALNKINTLTEEFKSLLKEGKIEDALRVNGKIQNLTNVALEKKTE